MDTYAEYFVTYIKFLLWVLVIWKSTKCVSFNKPFVESSQLNVYLNPYVFKSTEKKVYHHVSFLIPSLSFNGDCWSSKSRKVSCSLPSLKLCNEWCPNLGEWGLVLSFWIQDNSSLGKITVSPLDISPPEIYSPDNSPLG